MVDFALLYPTMDNRNLTAISRLLSSDIKKPTALVHFQRNMSPVEQRIMTLLIFNAQETDADENGYYDIQAKFVLDFLGWDHSNNYMRVYEAFRAIKSNDIVWNFLGEDRTLDELHCSFLITLGISRRSGRIRYKFHPELLPVIRNPSVFAKLKLVMLAILARPKYAYPFYEFIADSYCRGKPIHRISLDKLKDYLGIPAASYTDYIMLKNQVIKPTLAAINEISDYSVKYKTYRIGRRVVGIILDIAQKRQWQQPLLLERPVEVLRRYFGVETPFPAAEHKDEVNVQTFLKAIGSYGINERTAREAIAAHGLQAAKEILAKVTRDIERRKRTDNPITDAVAYLARCLHDGYGVLSPQERARDAAESAREERSRQREQEKALSATRQSSDKARVASFIDALTPQEKAEYEKRFRLALDSGVWGEPLRGKAIDAPGMQAIFRAFVASEMPSLSAPSDGDAASTP